MIGELCCCTNGAVETTVTRDSLVFGTGNISRVGPRRSRRVDNSQCQAMRSALETVHPRETFIGSVPGRETCKFHAKIVIGTEHIRKSHQNFAHYIERVGEHTKNFEVSRENSYRCGAHPKKSTLENI